MKAKLFFLISIGILFLLACSKGIDKDEVYECVTLYSEKSTEATLKGYILFSWENNQNSWNYSIVPNLNISPASERVGAGNIFSGEECLKNNLELLAEGEDVFWSAFGEVQKTDGGKVSLSYPPESVVNTIRLFCDSIKIDLTVE